LKTVFYLYFFRFQSWSFRNDNPSYRNKWRNSRKFKPDFIFGIKQNKLGYYWGRG